MKSYRLLSITCAAILAFFISVLIGTCITYKPEYPMADLEDNWIVSINGHIYENVSCFDFYKILKTPLKRGDDVTMTTTLPDLGNIPFPAILFRSRYTTLQCFINDRVILDFGHDMYYERKFIGKMYHFITLPNDYAGKKFVMKMKVGENAAFSSLDCPIIGSQPNIESKFINDRMMIIATGMFLFVFGIVFFCINIFFVDAVSDVKGLVAGSLFCIDLGVWIMSYYNVLTPFFYTPYETELEYFTLYLIVPFCYLVMYFVQKIERKKLYLTAAFVTCLVTLTQYILHYIFNIHLRATLTMYHCVGLLGFILIMYYLVKNIVKKDISASGMMQMSGVVALAVAEIMHLVIYIQGTLHIKTNGFLSIIIIDTGCLVYVMCQLANYMLFVTQSYAQKQENTSLTHLAYADGLTNLPNRARSDKMLEDLDDVETDYCIISVDLNGLKYVNDKFGHPSGDKYIKDFSKVLSTTFGDVGFISRIGGDEFLVLISDANGIDIDALLGTMTSALNVMNALYSEYKRSVASGYAFRHECPRDASSHEVYLLADQRMYENKRRMHEELGIKNRL